MVVGVVSGVLAIAALGCVVLRRQAVEKRVAGPPAPHLNGGDNLEHGCEHDDVSNPTSSIVVRGNGLIDPQSQQNSSPPRLYTRMHQRSLLPPPNQLAAVAPDANTDDCERAQSLSRAPPVVAVLSSTDETVYSGEKADSLIAGVRAEDSSADQLLLKAATPAADGSAEKRTKHDGIGFSTRDDVGSLPDVPDPQESGASSAAGGRRTSGGLGYGQAVMAAAEKLANHCQTPGVSEAATMVSILIHLVSDSRDEMGRGDASVKRCRSMVMMLERAAKVLGKVRWMARACGSCVLECQALHKFKSRTMETRNPLEWFGAKQVDKVLQTGVILLFWSMLDRTTIMTRVNL